MQFECQTQYGGDRRQRDVALLPRQAHAENVLLPLPFAAADDAEIGNGAGVRARLGAGEREARNLESLREARQVVLLLLARPVMQQQFRGAERVRHHYRDRRRAAARGELHHYLGVGERRESQPAVLLGDDHADEAFVPYELPDMRRQVAEDALGAPAIVDGPEAIDEVRECGDGEHVDTPFLALAGPHVRLSVLTIVPN